MFAKLGYYICVPFAFLTRLFYSWTGSYGVALILFTLVVKLVLLPFQLKSKKSMLRMNRMQGKIKDIQTRYANNQQRQKEAMQELYMKEGINPIAFSGLKLSITSEESKAINFDETPKVIISASGMCDAGRIRHHLKHNLWREECTILFVGYQSVGTLGRVLVEGADEVKLFGETIQVRAQIRKLAGLSGHADKEGLIEWIQAFEEKPKKVFVVHGEDSACTAFTECLKIEYGQRAYAPYSGTEFDLISNKFTYEAAPVAVKKKTKPVTGVFERLLASARRLLALVTKSEGVMTNKDMAKFADQINSLCDKWEI